MLTDLQKELWDDYLNEESRGVRKRALHLLDGFIDQLLQAPVADWQDWVFDIAKQVVDDDIKIPIRNPLFKRVIFPALFDGQTNGIPNCSRWLAGFAQHLYQSNECQIRLPDNLRTECGLLLAALQSNPEDSKAGHRLIAERARWLNFSLHELPLGVLYGMDGASAEESLKLQEVLEFFVKLTEKFGQFDLYSHLIADCDFHFKAYRNFLLSDSRQSGYPAYLASIGCKLE